jgi:hypothetical protein
MSEATGPHPVEVIDPDTLRDIRTRDEPEDEDEAIRVLDAKCRVSYNLIQSLMNERSALCEQLSGVNGALAAVQMSAAKYAVQQPVIASDGFTYEQMDMATYMTQCMNMGTPPVSQITREPLEPFFPPNRTLFQVLKLLQTAQPVSVRPMARVEAPDEPPQ